MKEIKQLKKWWKQSSNYEQAAGILFCGVVLLKIFKFTIILSAISLATILSGSYNVVLDTLLNNTVELTFFTFLYMVGENSILPIMAVILWELAHGRD